MKHLVGIPFGLALMLIVAGCGSPLDESMTELDSGSSGARADSMAQANQNEAETDGADTAESKLEKMGPLAKRRLRAKLAKRIREKMGSEQPDPSEAPAPDPDPAGSASCPTCTFGTCLSDADFDTDLPPCAASFAGDVAQIFAHVLITDIPTGDYEMAVDYIVPDGYVYRRDTIRFLVGEVSGGLQGYAWEYVDAIPYMGGYLVAVALPVAGDMIEEYGIYGSWQVDVWLDNDEAPADSVPFQIVAP